MLDSHGSSRFLHADRAAAEFESHFLAILGAQHLTCSQSLADKTCVSILELEVIEGLLRLIHRVNNGVNLDRERPDLHKADPLMGQVRPLSCHAVDVPDDG